jgi:hypothetical protein
MCQQSVPSIIEGLISNRGKLSSFKDNLSSIFRDMGSFMFSTSNQLESFLRIMEPYIRYFYPAEITPDGECFINEVVNPCRIEMDSAIDMAVRIMEGDDQINDTVSNAIKRVLEIQSDVDRILSVIEAIEIYAVNATLVATKAGSEGFPLTKISQEMSKLSERANWVSTGCRGLIDELDDAFDRFSKLRESIGILNENYLTLMQVQSNLVFDELIEDLNGLSVDANDIMGFANDIEGSIGQVMKWLQIEDIVRQDLEKVIYLIEGVENGDPDGNLMSSITNPDDRERVIDLVALLARSKMLSIGENVKPLTDGTIECCEKIKGILSDFLGVVYRKDGTDENSPDGDRFNRIYRKLEEMKNEFIRLIKEIIDGKRNLYELSMRIFDMVNSFEGFFANLSGIAKHFETINMLTRIELAKHASLSRTLGVALTDVRDLPSRMKSIIGNSVVLYREVSKNIRASIDDYHQSYNRQEENLLSCIESMERISIKLSESQQYYGDISNEIGEVSSRILEYMESGAERLAGMIDFEDIINNFINMLEGDDGDISCEHIDTLRHCLNVSAGDSYRSTILSSFLSEAQRTRGESVLLF